MVWNSERGFVAVYDGNSFVYLTKNDGLLDNQVRFIQEEKKGIIGLTTQDGMSSYDGARIKNYMETNTKKLRYSIKYTSGRKLDENRE